ncbi:MAG: hypothetical protein RMJ33_01980 [Saprospiraceae bacterium]|nr:hypothetical protein [Saprospiraceae bacterium]MDW8228582.1 hypothetical protein [Saprospiraceae bacterium]
MMLSVRFGPPFILLLLAWLCACRPSEPGITEEVECYVRYLKPEGQTLAEMVVRRRAGNEARPAEIPGGVRYRGTPMQAIALDSATTYRLEGKNPFATEHSFAWTDTRGRPREFVLSMPPISNLSFGGKTLPIRQPATLRWSGPPITQNEAWVILWEKTDQSAVTPMEIITAAGMDYIEFPAAQLAKLGPGTWSYYVVRQKAFRQEEAGLLLKGIAEYYSDPDTIRLVK